jgi:antitoxin component of RelBE/YafQ-DinJ toxin-antitoxin module
MNFGGYKAKVHLKPAAVKVLTEAQKKAIGMTAEQLLHEVVEAQVIPFDVGTLQNVATYVETKELENGQVSIVHEAPYAERLYFNPQYDFQTTFNANAQGLWWDKWINGSKKGRAKALFKEFYRRVSGGYVK